MPAAPLRWMTDRLSMASRLLRVWLWGVPRQLRHALARRNRVHTPAHTPCCTLGPAVCHIHGLDQFDLRGEQVTSPQTVIGDGLVTIEAERYSNFRSR